ncbi:hypothetical protein HanPI659440_Chr04g0167501 [Helianthus annuus]|nr:hypothetical protein HanPI659440_Chr04g0167501 [Helianthus annuus]
MHLNWWKAVRKCTFRLRSQANNTIVKFIIMAQRYSAFISSLQILTEPKDITLPSFKCLMSSSLGLTLQSNPICNYLMNLYISSIGH